MVIREDNVGSCVKKKLSSFSYGAFEEVISHVDANRVITWIRPIKESWADAFWKRFSFPSYVCVSLSSLRPQFVAYMDRDRGVMNSIY